MFCGDCGSSISDGAKFCPDCGAVQDAPVTPPAQEAQTIQQPMQPPAIQQQPIPPVPPPMQAQPSPGANFFPAQAAAKAKKFPVWLLVIIIALPLLAGGVVGGYFLLRGGGNLPDIKPDITPENLADVSYTYQSKKPEAIIDFVTVDSIFPSNYRTLESLATFTGYCDYGEMDVLIEVEVLDFTQKYMQKVTLGRQVTKLRIVPPLLANGVDLNSEQPAQLVYSVTESDTGRLLVKESKNIKLYSKYDIIWWTEEFGDASTDDILAWMTPDASEVVALKRDAIDYLSMMTEGNLQMLIGYQDIGLFDGDRYMNTWVQAVAIQGAISYYENEVRYNNSHFSMDAWQRVLLPADVLRTKSGICVETSLLMASALQSMGMHCMLIFPPGHSQVAVEAWPGTGDYYLIETTMLPMDNNVDAWRAAVKYLDKEAWLGYITGEGPYTLGECYVLDCDLGAKLGIRAINN